MLTINKMNRELPNYQSGGPRPQNFSYYPQCGLHQQAQLLPDERSVTTTAIPANPNVPDCMMAQVPMAPSTVKHLYPSHPEGYEQRFQTVQVGTLYDHQFVETWPTGMGRQKVLGGGHYKVYPLTNRHVIESRDYTSYSFPRPQWSTERNPRLVTTTNHVRV